MPVDVTAAVAALTKLGDAIDAATRNAVFEGAARVDAAAKGNAPVLTGSLRRSIDIEGPTRVGLASYRARVGPTMIYGRIRELGGDIYPKQARILRWWDKAGNKVFAMHSHQVPRPYLKPAVEIVDFRRICEEHWGNAIRRTL